MIDASWTLTFRKNVETDIPKHFFNDISDISPLLGRRIKKMLGKSVALSETKARAVDVWYSRVEYHQDCFVDLVNQGTVQTKKNTNKRGTVAIVREMMELLNENCERTVEESIIGFLFHQYPQSYPGYLPLLADHSHLLRVGHRTPSHTLPWLITLPSWVTMK